MNIHNNIFTILFSILSVTLFSQETLVSIDKGETSLEEVITILETDYGFLFSYKVDDVKNVIVFPSSRKATINVFLTTILKPTRLDFEIVQDNYIILKKKDDEQNSNNSSKSNLPLLCGKIIDDYTQEPLPFANIFVQKNQQGTTTAKDGSFKFYADVESNDTIVLSYVGYQEIKILAKDLIGKPRKTFSFKYYEFSEDLIVVTDYLTDGITLQGNSSFTQLSPNKIKALPGQAEPDVLRTIQFLPGISSPEGSASSISIRGGTPDQNLILWEDIPVYHSAHYFGNLSAFNPYIIDQAKVFRGGFNSEYGGRISGVIDLKTEDLEEYDKSKIGIGLNFIDVNANGQLVFLNNKASITFSIRRSISEIWRSPTFENLSQRVHRGILFQTPANAPEPDNIKIDDEFHFFDSNVKASFQLSKKNKISFAGFYGENDFQSVLNNKLRNQIQDDSLFLENSGMSLSWERKWNSKFSSKVSALVSDYHYDYDYSLMDLNGMNNPNNKFGIKKSRINEEQFHFSNLLKTKKNHNWKLGYQFINYDVGYQITQQNQDNPQANQNKDYQSNVHIGYGSFNTSNEKRIGFNLGIRTSYLESEDQTYIEPRLKIWYKLNEHLGLNLNTGKYYQFLSQLEQIEGDRASIETPVWVLTGEKEAPILDANQLQLGFVFNKNDWLIDVQSYLKNINGLTSLATGFDEELTGRIHYGSAKVRGLDILIKRRWGNYSSWMSYSISKVNHQFDSFFDPEFNASNDQPHNFHWVNLWTYNKLEFSLGWKIASGTPYSLKENFRIEVDPGPMGSRERIVAQIKEYNGERLPARHQLDASVLYNFVSKTNAKWNGKIGLSLFNIYNQKNIYNRGFFMDIRPNAIPRLEYTDQLELGFTPNFIFRIEL